MFVKPLVTVLLLLSLALCGLPSFAAIVTLDIEAHIDGRDRLMIRDGTLQWEHFEFGAVGRHHNNVNSPTIISTAVDGVPVLERVEWFPEWSVPPPTPIRQPELSSVFTALEPHTTEMKLIGLEAPQIRSEIALIQRPNPENLYTTILQFDDNSKGGASWYHARLTYETDVAPQPPQARRWQIEATVTDIDDLNGVFPDVRLGDTVRGILKYDLRAPDLIYVGDVPVYIEDEATFYGYLQPPWFGIASMVIENPRTGSEIRFEKDLHGFPPVISIFSDGVDEAGITARQSIARPWSTIGPGDMYVDLLGPPGILPDWRLPAELNLDDWPLAAMEFLGSELDDEGSLLLTEYILAEIYSLTPITTPPPPGDYDYDEHVGQADHIAWKATFGSRSEHYADGNGNGVVDAADYVVWRKGIQRSPENGATDAASTVAVPEPNVLLLTAIFALSPIIQRLKRIPSKCVPIRQTRRPILASNSVQFHR